MGAKVDYQIAAPAEMSTPNLHGAKIAQKECGWKDADRGGAAPAEPSVYDYISILSQVISLADRPTFIATVASGPAGHPSLKPFQLLVPDDCTDEIYFSLAVGGPIAAKYLMEPDGGLTIRVRMLPRIPWKIRLCLSSD